MKQVTIKYKALLSWTESGKFYENIFCNVVHIVQHEPDGSFKTIDLKWAAYPEEP